MNIIKADFSNPKHSEVIINLLNEYALHPMGGGMIKKSLAAFMMIKTAQGYQILPDILSCFDDKQLPD
ncbi:MAG: hypothetical protein OEV42_20085 [Deltaproteobacteria bacterium]|nr:hypothetical protein [Deltaproteobacteria bacterium]